MLHLRIIKILLIILLIMGTFSFFLIPEPAYADNGLIVTCNDSSKVPGEDGCREANILLLQIIRIGDYLFTIIGMVAFVSFVSGGLMFILSMGNAEKAKKGQQMLVAAVVGLIIAFSAYILIGFLLDALGVGSEFRIIG
jgi:hypothetical protein